MQDRLEVYSEKLGGSVTVSVEAGRMVCQEAGFSADASATMWKNGYWEDGSTWDHNAWEDKW